MQSLNIRTPLGSDLGIWLPQFRDITISTEGFQSDHGRKGKNTGGTWTLKHLSLKVTCVMSTHTLEAGTHHMALPTCRWAQECHLLGD